MEPFEIDQTVWLIDTGLYRPDQHTLALADLHLGYEEAMRQAGVMLPETRFDDLLGRLDGVFCALDVSSKTPLNELILNGDVRHTFGPLNAAEWRELNAFFQEVSPFCKRIVVVEGNHDPTLTAFANRFSKVQTVSQWQQEGWLYTHGDRVPELSSGVTTIVIGHEHPALSLKDPVTGRRERYKTFLQGHFAERALWVLPSCNALLQGTDLAKEGVLSPLLAEGVWQSCLAYARDDQGRIYPFGPLNRLI